jgi:hypothetical protein
VAILGRGLTPGAALSFAPGEGWTSPQDLNLFVQGGAVTAHKGGAVAMVRRASSDPAEQDALFSAPWSAGVGFSDFTPVGKDGFASAGPSLASNNVAIEVAFLGLDFKHYMTQLGDGGVIAPFGPFPGGQAGQQAFGQSVIQLATQGNGTWAAYAGDNGQLYYSSKSGPGSLWAFSSSAPTSPVVPTIAPALQTFAGGVTFAYVKSQNGRIAINTLIQPQNSWMGELTVGTTAITKASPGLLRIAADDYLVVWHGFDDSGIYFSRGGAAGWSPPAPILVPAEATSTPVLLPGVGDQVAEVLFTAGGVLRHARYDGASFTLGQVAATSNAVEVSAARVPTP